MSLKYCDGVIFPSIIPNNGNRKTGNKEVTAIGTLSKTHQPALISKQPASDQSFDPHEMDSIR